MSKNPNEDFWRHARRLEGKKEAELAHTLGFDRCQKCRGWFHLSSEEWVDCVVCGRHCPGCADGTEWEWCDQCGFHYCLACYGDERQFICQVCSIF